MKTSVLFLLLLATACARQFPEFVLPSPVSRPAVPSPGGFRAGFGRADITPPPGVPLDGASIENQQSDGWQHRLYARAMVLEGANGERIAYLITDLSHVSSLLQRRTAERILAETGIGADRLILSGTHTHSAPGNFYTEQLYNQESGGLPGYDPYMVEFMVDRFARAVTQAVHDLTPAKGAWIQEDVQGYTWNRSYGAFKLNATTHFPVTADVDSVRRQQALNHTWTLLRIDQCRREWGGECLPVGAFSVFPLHGTGIPPASRLIDGDLHSVIERGLERHIDSINTFLGSSRLGGCDAVGATDQVTTHETGPCRFSSGAFHLFANGTEGDVAPRHLPGARCGEELEEPHLGARPFSFLRTLEPEGPHITTGMEEWRLPAGKTFDNCLDMARRSVNEHGDALVRRVNDLFDRAKSSLHSNIDIARAFATLDLLDPAIASTLCTPRAGTANVAGDDDMRTRFDHWRLLGLFPTGMEEGNSAINLNRDGCHGAKRIALGPLQGIMFGKYGLPRYAQFSVVRIGDQRIASLPWEITSEAGARMTSAMDEIAASGGHSAIVGLANGYFQYLTTPEEYEAQEYEGGSNLYGPNTANFVQDVLARLTRELNTPSHPAVVHPIPAVPGPQISYFRRPTEGPTPEKIKRAVTFARCELANLPATPGTTETKGAKVATDLTTWRFTAEWIDAYPGVVLPAMGQVVEIQRRLPDGRYAPVAWDDGAAAGGHDRRVEVYAVRPVHGGYLWRVMWIADTSVVRDGSAVRLVLPPRPVPDRSRSFPSLPAGTHVPSDTVPVAVCGARK